LPNHYGACGSPFVIAMSDFGLALRLRDRAYLPGRHHEISASLRDIREMVTMLPVVVHFRHRARGCVVNIENTCEPGRLKQPLVSFFSSPSNAVNVDHTRGWVRIRGKAKGVDPARKPVDRAIDGFGQWDDSSSESYENVIELLEHMQPVFVLRDLSSPQLVDPANARLAALFPTLDGVDIWQVFFGLAPDKEYIIFASKPDLMETGIHKDRSTREIPKHQLPLPFVLELVARAWFEAEEVNIVNLRKDVLSFIMTTKESFFLEVSPTGQTNPQLPRWLRWSLESLPHCAISV